MPRVQSVAGAPQYRMLLALSLTVAQLGLFGLGLVGLVSSDAANQRRPPDCLLVHAASVLRLAAVVTSESRERS